MAPKTLTMDWSPLLVGAAIGAVLGSLGSLGIAHAYYRWSSVHPPNWARPLIEHLPQSPPSPERLVQLYLKTLAPTDQWRRVLESSIAQLELLNELDPSQPRTALGVLKARLDSALAEFRAAHSLDAAAAIVEIAPALLKKATDVYARPSSEFRQLWKELGDALAEVRAQAQARVSTVESSG
jgi:hypothetical protein